MPSPFPGMDPFLESPRGWRNIHDRFAVYCNDELNLLLPDAFQAKINEYVYVGASRRPKIPDAIVVHDPYDKAADLPLHIRFSGEEEIMWYVEVVLGDDPDTVVTAIEILSPSNKENGHGREEYIQKQQGILQSRTHLIEIDLLRGGQHTVAVPDWGIRAQRDGWDYLVCLHRAMSGDSFDVWPFTMRDRLPVISVPLTEEYDDVPLDLQAVFTQMYDRGGFTKRRGLYEGEPVPPLSPENSGWIRQLLHDKNMNT